MDVRQLLLGKKDRVPTRLHEVDDGAFVVFVMPSERVFMELGERLQSGKISKYDYEAELLLKCLRNPVLGKDKETDELLPQLDEDGFPLTGKPVFEKADLEALTSESHAIGGWLRQLKQAFTEFIAEESAEMLKDAPEGNSPTGSSRAGSLQPTTDKAPTTSTTGRRRKSKGK